MPEENRKEGSRAGALTPEQNSWRWKVLIATYFGYAGYYLTRKVFSICKTSLAEEFDVGLDSIAHIWTAYLIAYMLGMFINSFIGRRWGPRILLLDGLGCSIIINVIYNIYHQYGIKVGFHYIPLHWTTAFQKRGFKKGQFPIADKVGEQLITLPINPRQ